MAFLKNMYQKLLGEEADEETENDVANESSEETFADEAMDGMTEERKNFASKGSSLELKIAKLAAFDGNVMELADHLIAGRPVVLNLESASKEAVKRIIDFFSGVAYTVKGQLKNISGNIYIVTPSNVDVSNESKLFSAGKAASSANKAAPSAGDGASPYEGF